MHLHGLYKNHMVKKAFVIVHPYPICMLPIVDIKDSCVQIESGRRVHLECHQGDALAKEQTRLNKDTSTR